VEHGHEHKDPPRVRHQLQLPQPATDAWSVSVLPETLNWCCSCSRAFLESHAIVRFRIIGSDLRAEEAFTVSWHVSDPSSRDSAVRAIHQAADIAGDLQSLQGTLLFFARSSQLLHLVKAAVRCA
jgi:hypothetical protein